MFTKPCERADRGCAGLVTGTTLNRLARNRFCSRRCGCLARVEAGRGPSALMTREQLSEAGRFGGTTSGSRRRVATMQRQVGDYRDDLRIALAQTSSHLTPDGYRVIDEFLGRIHQSGWKLGHQSGWHKAETFLEQARKREAAA